MADVRVEEVAFNSPQAIDAPFEVEVEVNNLETVAPLWGADALCSKGVMAPDGHRVDVTLIIERSGVEVFEETQEVCAPVQAPSQAFGGNARATFQPELSTSGDHTVRAEIEAMPSGSDVSDSHRLAVEDDIDNLPEGSEPGGGIDLFPDNDDDPDEDNPFDLPEIDAVDDAKLAVGVVLLIALLYAFGQGFDVELGSESA